MHEDIIVELSVLDRGGKSFRPDSLERFVAVSGVGNAPKDDSLDVKHVLASGPLAFVIELGSGNEGTDGVDMDDVGRRMIGVLSRTYSERGVYVTKCTVNPH